MAVQPVRNPVNDIPSFMTFDIDVQGPSLYQWSIKPYNEWFTDSLGKEEVVKIIGKNMIVGTVIGASVGVGIALITRAHCGSLRSTEEGESSILLATGCIAALATKLGFVGMVVGLAKGVIAVQKFHLERPIVLHQTLVESEQAKKIIKSFMTLCLEGQNDENDALFCPITREVMVYPIDVHCGSPVPHTFEFFSILQWLQKSSHCPLCNKAVSVGNFTRDTVVESKIHGMVGRVFIKMEAILQKLPKRLFGLDSLPNFFESHNISQLAEMIKKGKCFLSDDIKTIQEKIKDPNTLSLEETFALGYFLIHQFRPLKQKIDDIYRILSRTLVDMRIAEVVDDNVLAIQTNEVAKWHAAFNIIPQNCTAIKKLYSMRQV
jgi:hypothetical protein